MSFRILCCRKLATKLLPVDKTLNIQSATYAKKAAGGKLKGAAAPIAQKKHLTPETDPVKLTTRVCGGNILKEGEDPVLKPDSEYPDWLWSLRTEREPVPLEELSEDSWEYWQRLARMEKKRSGLWLKTRNRYKYY